MLEKIAKIGEDVEKYLDLLSKRQQLIASNIANMDTPGYKTKDIDFKTEFAAALQGNSSPEIREVGGLTAGNDGNNVSIDREALLLADTAFRYQMGLQFLKGEVEDTKKAIQES